MQEKAPPALHSRYNPQAEASRFIDASIALKEPLFIVVTEPGEGFLAEELKKKYPGAKICAIRYQNEFYLKSDALWDFCWRPSCGIPLETFLFNIIPDEAMPASVFLSWKASERFWPKATESAWNAIASFIRLEQSVMATRAAFGKRWLTNTIKNIAKAVCPVLAPKIEAPPLILASGPSLESYAPDFFAELSSRFFICALSSASFFLSAKNTNLDAIISTDGGYWAGRLFSKKFALAPAMFPPEAFIPNFMLKSSPCVFLSYGSALENELFLLSGIRPLPAKRNGTVAGTAALLFLCNTRFNVYAAGLDLKAGKVFQHARPHPFSLERTAGPFRLNPLASQAAGAELSSSLSIYRSWFENMPKKSAARLFRIESCKGELLPLGDIQSIDSSRLLSIVPAKKEKVKESLVPSSSLSMEERARNTREWLLEMVEKLKNSKTIEEVESEIIKMHSYQDFLSLTKAESLNDAEKAREAMQGMRKGAASFLSLLAEKLK